VDEWWHGKPTAKGRMFKAAQVATKQRAVAAAEAREQQVRREEGRKGGGGGGANKYICY